MATWKWLKQSLIIYLGLPMVSLVFIICFLIIMLLNKITGENHAKITVKPNRFRNQKT